MKWLYDVDIIMGIFFINSLLIEELIENTGKYEKVWRVSYVYWLLLRLEDSNWRIIETVRQLVMGMSLKL